MRPPLLCRATGGTDWWTGGMQPLEFPPSAIPGWGRPAARRPPRIFSKCALGSRPVGVCTWCENSPCAPATAQPPIFLRAAHSKTRQEAWRLGPGWPRSGLRGPKVPPGLAVIFGHRLGQILQHFCTMFWVVVNWAIIKPHNPGGGPGSLVWLSSSLQLCFLLYLCFLLLR